MRAKLIFTVGIIVLASVLGYVFFLLIKNLPQTERFPIAWFIIVAAIIGSAVNQSSRKDNLKNAGGGQIIVYLLWKCCVSIVFAFVLHLMFIGDLVSGDMFPKYVHTNISNGGAYTNMINFATGVDPESNKDTAKLLVWCFIAGYSEKYVPNLITRISSHSSGESGATG